MRLQTTISVGFFSLVKAVFVIFLTSAVLFLATDSTRAQPGVVAYWNADGTADDIVGGNNGTFQVSGPAYASGYAGQAFSFDGTRYIEVPDSAALSPMGPFTIEAWIKPNFNNFQQGIVEKYVVPGLNGFFLRMNSSGRLQFGVCSTTCGAIVTGQSPVSTGNWHHVAAIYDGSDIRIYLDEVMDAYGPTQAWVPTDGPTTLKIGARGDDANTRFNGLIDEVKLYDIALPLPIPVSQHNVADGDVTGLIAAITASNVSPGPDAINLAANGTYTLTQISPLDDWGGTGLPPITSEVTINGNGATIQRSDADGTPFLRLLRVVQSKVTLDRVTLRSAYIPDSAGGGLNGYGAGCDITVRNSTITGNRAQDGAGISATDCILRVENSTISYNTAFGARTGGGILNFVSHTFVSNSTIFENRADGSPGFEGRGDAIADGFSAPDAVVIKNSIVASPTRGAGIDCAWFTPVSLGHNIFSDSSCGQNIGSGDMIIPNLALGPLVNNGGLTPTHALLPGSPAIDVIPVADCANTAGVPVAFDQRGTSRPIGVGCDIGAVEQDPFDTTSPSIVPTVVGALGDNGWYTSDVSISWSVTDGESDVSSSSGCDNSTVNQDTNGATFTCSATSAGGTGSQSVTIKRDATAPTITVSSPTGANYLLNQTVAVDFSCSDALSGIASCVGATGNGGALDTASVGTKTFTVNATDNAGNNAAPLVVNYSVGYAVESLFDQSKAYKSGSTVPIKLHILDANGVNVSTSSITLHAVSVIQVNNQASSVLDDSGNSNPDFDFRYDSQIGGYIFNLKTTGYGTGRYLLNFNAGGSTNVYAIGFQIRQ